MNPKEFMKKWIQGIKDITPLQQLHAEMIGYRGNIVSMIFALIFLSINGMWYFSFFMIFTTFLQVVALIGVQQKYRNMLALTEAIEQEQKTHIETSEELLIKLGGER